MRRLLLFLLFALPTWAQQTGLPNDPPQLPSNLYQIPSFISGTSGGAAALAGNANSIYASPSCPNPSQGNCFFVNDNLRYVIDATWSNGATPVLITISGGDTPFTSADTGKTCYGIGGSGANTAPIGTFTFLTATTGTCSGTSSGSAASNGVFVLGNDDTTLLNAAYAAVLALPRCGSLVLPSGFMMVSGPIFATATPTACQVLNQDGAGVNVLGQGEHATYFVPRPDTTFVAVTNQFMGSAQQIFEGFQVFGATATGANTSGKVGILFGTASIGRQVAITQWASSVTFNAIVFQGQEDSCVQCFTDSSGTISVAAIQVQCYECFSSNGFSVTAGDSFYDFGGVYTASTLAVPTTISGTFNGYSTTISNGFVNPSNAVSIQNAAAVFSCEYCTITDNTNAGSQGIAWTAAGTVILSNSTVNGGATTGAIYNVGVPGAILISGGNNKFTGGFANWTGTWRGPEIKNGSCSGVATAASTLGLYGLGQFTALTCTSTTVNLGVVTSILGQNGTLNILQATAGTGGTNASSGVVTVLKNGSATALTCTIGTGTSCTDNTHSVAYVVGDVISIQFTTQAADTLANVKASVLTL